MKKRKFRSDRVPKKAENQTSDAHNKNKWFSNPEIIILVKNLIELIKAIVALVAEVVK